MSTDRKKLNDQWCEFHWAPYRDPHVNGIVGALSLMQAIIDNPDFSKEVNALVTKKVERNVAAQRVMDNWVYRKHKKPMCCILGDSVMAGILASASPKAN